MYHVLTSSGTYVTFVCTSCHPPSDTSSTNNIHFHSSYFSFTRNSVTVH
jgi:hypothetical protein